MRTIELVVAIAVNFACSCAYAEGPSFNCTKAKQAAEIAICANSKLSQLDRILAAGYNYIKNATSLAAADKIGIPYYYQRLACGPDVECIGRSQLKEIQDLASAGAPVTLPGWAMQRTEPQVGTSTYVPLASDGGTFLVPVTINEQITLKFVLDSGASDVSIPADVVLTLMRAGSIGSDDFLGSQTYTLADGSSVPSPTFNIRSLRVGDRVLQNVRAAIAPVKGNLLLGQSFLSRFQSWAIDNNRQALVLR
jgi:aspartyl protease family protein